VTATFGILSTYPPTQCGLASFTASLASALAVGSRPGAVGIVEVADDPGGPAAPEVVHRWGRGVRGNEAAAAAALDRFDVAIVQHEYGIYDGWDGDAVLEVLEGVAVPVIVVLHTVLAAPTAHQRIVLEAVVRAASSAVVMTGTARQRLLDGYSVDPSKVEVIAHGAPTDWSSGSPRRTSRRSNLLTWGLLGPGKGVEWVIDAVALLSDLRPPPRYLVLGETHPRVLEHQGEAYREALAARASERAVASSVEFDNRYVDRVALRRRVADADVVVLPYDSTDQVTSGVLIEAVIARRPIVATAFPHAVELLSGGAGTIVAHRDPAAIAVALRRILTEPGVAAGMVAEAERLAPDLTWATVATGYRRLGQRLRSHVEGVRA
jgi:glycosyltransferase involved in cell wall biosynthesis